MEIKLNELPINKEGVIKDIKITGEIKRRLLDLGLINNTKIKPILKSPLNDPTAYLIRGSVIALRKEDAKKIIVSYDENSRKDVIYNGLN